MCSIGRRYEVSTEPAPVEGSRGHEKLCDRLHTARGPEITVEGLMLSEAEQPPLAYPTALGALAGCFASTVRLLWQRRMHLPAERTEMRLRFADGTTARVYRETAVDRGATLDPCVLVVTFRLRMVRGWGHALFRLESLLNTPLFAGFPGFVSKLWLADDERGRYRGLYEWDGPKLANNYARALWRVLALVSVRGSIHYVVLSGLRRDELLERPLVSTWPGADTAWWRLTEVT